MMVVTPEQAIALEQLVGSPFVRGARGPKAYDCLGLTLEGLRILRPDLVVMDPWHEYEARWKSGWRPTSGEVFPEGWQALSLEDTHPEPGDVLGFGRCALGVLEHLDLKVWGSLVLRTRPATGGTFVDFRQVQFSLVCIMRPPQ